MHKKVGASSQTNYCTQPLLSLGLYLSGNDRGSLEIIKEREVQEQKDTNKVDLVAERKIDIEESKDDNKSTFNGSKGNEIEHKFEGFSKYEGEGFDSYYEKYISGVREKRGCISKERKEKKIKIS